MNNKNMNKMTENEIKSMARKMAIEQLKKEEGVEYEALSDAEKDAWGHWLGDAAWIAERQLRGL